PGSFTVSVKTLAQAAYDLDTRLGLSNPGGNYSYNARGRGEKYISGAGGRWFFIVPDCGFYEILASTGYSIDQSVFLSKLDNSYWANPALLHDAAASTATAPALSSTITALGSNQYNLALGSFAGYVGKLQVTVTASDGANQSARSFLLAVTNQPPVLENIADATVGVSAQAAAVTFRASDPDSPLAAPGSFSVSFKALAQTAYDLDTQLGLTNPGGNYSYNA